MFIGSVWPEPSSSAAGRRTLDLLKLLQTDHWEIHFASSALKTEFSSDLEQFKILEHQIQVNSESFDQLALNLNPQLVVFDRFFTEEQFGWRIDKMCPDALRVIDTIDLHCLREARKSLLKPNNNLNLFEALLAEEKTVREIAAIYRSDFSIMISEFEISLLQDRFGVAPELLLPCGFWVDEIPTEFKSFENRQDFMTIGNFKHEPNLDSVRWLKSEIWPLIRKSLPQAQLNVYGSYVNAHVSQMNDPSTGFHILGRADDAELVMSKARVCLAALRFGAGLKGKLLESMLTGTPNVTTSIGAEGMQGDQPWNGLIADNAHDFSAAAVELYSNQKLWENSQVNGQKLLKNRFSKTLQSRSLLVKTEDHLQNKKDHRQKNFVGQMLRHHQFNSTKYLSNWIQLKNRQSSKI